MAKLAEEAGIDFLHAEESHQEYFTTKAHLIIIVTLAQGTKKVKRSSSSTIISTLDPVRVHEYFATFDLILDGRTKILASFVIMKKFTTFWITEMTVKTLYAYVFVKKGKE